MNAFLRLSPVMRYALGAAVLVVLVVLGNSIWLLSGPGPTDFAGGRPVALAQYKAADPTGVPGALAHASLVERGEYLTRAADCTACHTAQGGTPYAGGLAINLPFGTIYSTNITPDKETGIGNWTDADFLNAVHRGIGRDGMRLYPAMPYPSYTYMTDADALAIKAYLFSLAPVHAPGKEITFGFPFNQRWLMGFWDAFLSADKRFEPNAARSPEWNRGAYIAEALHHCGECHTPRNIGFALDNRRKFAGALAGGWRSYDITSDPATGIGAWRDDELFTYLAKGHATGHGTASGVMGEAVDASFSLMAPEDIRAIVVYLRSIPAIGSPDLPARLAPPAPASPKQGVVASDALGKHMFEGACAACHGWTGVSPVSPFATLTGARDVNDPSATNVAQIIISGTTRKTPDGVISMPAFGKSFSNIEIAAVANYVTARFGAKPSSVTERDIAGLRRETAQP
ncbi:MAG TPA: c-type cytochrome [Rhizomicrobium sp.]|jgi:mono/diheme cytochrome c family protein|nr:c-type cytochrome [Rhizomicrobium sp.]